MHQGLKYENCGVFVECFTVFTSSREEGGWVYWYITEHASGQVWVLGSIKLAIPGYQIYGLEVTDATEQIPWPIT